MTSSRTLPKLSSLSPWRSLIFLWFPLHVSDFCYLPEIALPYRRRADFSLLPTEVNGWISRNHFAGLRRRTMEVENYRLNSSVFGVSTACVLDASGHFQMIFGALSCYVPSCNHRVPNYGRWYRFLSSIEVWIYFRTLAFLRIAEIGTYFIILAHAI